MGRLLVERVGGGAGFGGTTVTGVLQKVLGNEAVSLAWVRAGLAPAVYALVDRCTSAEPRRRPPDGEAMRVALGQARLADPSVSIPPPHKTKPVASVAMASTHGAIGSAPTFSPPLGNAPSAELAAARAQHG